MGLFNKTERSAATIILDLIRVLDEKVKLIDKSSEKSWNEIKGFLEISKNLIAELENLKISLLKNYVEGLKLALSMQEIALKNNLMKEFRAGLIEETTLANAKSATGIPAKKAESLVLRLDVSGIFYYFKQREVMDLFEFIEMLIDFVNKNNIKIVYSVDKSGRILGILLHSVMNDLRISEGIKFYFIKGNMDLKGFVPSATTIYSEKQKEELEGKNVLVVDEIAVSGSTLKKVCRYLQQFTGEGKVFSIAFSSSAPSGIQGMVDYVPSWHGSEQHAGITETEEGVESLKDKAFTRNVRNSLRKFAKLIAEYIVLKADL